jgi:hypothetical protein
LCGVGFDRAGPVEGLAGRPGFEAQESLPAQPAGDLDGEAVVLFRPAPVVGVRPANGQRVDVDRVHVVGVGPVVGRWRRRGELQGERSGRRAWRPFRDLVPGGPAHCGGSVTMMAGVEMSVTVGVATRARQGGTPVPTCRHFRRTPRAAAPPRRVRRVADRASGPPRVGVGLEVWRAWRPVGGGVTTIPEGRQ